jgi:hypothetical protein
MIKMKVRRHSVSSTLKNLRKLGTDEYHEIEKEVLTAMAEVLEGAIRSNISLRDHTIQDLQALDYPYAKRHGSIKLHKGLPPKVHIQQGALERSLTTVMRRGRGGVGGSHAVARIGFLNNPPKYAAYVLWGTEKMLPRQVLVWTALHTKTKRQMFRAAVNVLGPKLRTQASVRM